MQQTPNAGEIRVQDVRRNDPSVVETVERIFAASGIRIGIDLQRSYFGASITRYVYKVESSSTAFSEKGKRRAEVDNALRSYFNVAGIRFDYGWLEVPLKNPVPPKVAELLATDAWKKMSADKTYIPLLLGVSSTGQPVVAQLGATGSGGYHPHMMIGGMGGSGKSELIATILTALHTCRTPQQLRIVLLYPHSDYFAFANSPLMRDLKNNIDVHRDAVSFMTEMVAYIRKRRTGKSEEELYRDEPNILFIIDNYESYQIGDTRKEEFKRLVEDCTSLGRGAHVHLLIVSAAATSRKISHGNVSGSMSFYNDRDGSRFVLGTPDAAKLSRIGDALYEVGYEKWVRVQTPLASREEQSASVEVCSNLWGHARGNESAGLKLAEFYLKGGVVPRDPEMANTIYRELAARGSTTAREALSRMESPSGQRTSWYLRANNETFGPVGDEQFVKWAREGRVQPGQMVSSDGQNWQKAEEIPLLEMHYSIDIGDGSLRGPFNRAAAEMLINTGKLPPGTRIVDMAAPMEEGVGGAQTPAVPQETRKESSVEMKEPKQFFGECVNVYLAYARSCGFASNPFDATPELVKTATTVGMAFFKDADLQNAIDDSIAFRRKVVRAIGTCVYAGIVFGCKYRQDPGLIADPALTAKIVEDGPMDMARDTLKRHLGFEQGAERTFITGLTDRWGEVCSGYLTLPWMQRQGYIAASMIAAFRLGVTMVMDKAKIPDGSEFVFGDEPKAQDTGASNSVNAHKRTNETQPISNADVSDCVGKLRGVTESTENSKAWKNALVDLVLHPDDRNATRVQETVALLKEAAEKGDASAQMTLGGNCESGNLLAQDFHSAAVWYERALKGGVPAAGFALGRLYEKGLGVNRDLAKARDLYWVAKQHNVEGAASAYKRMKRKLEEEKAVSSGDGCGINMRRVAIVGVDGSGKTVMLAGLGDLYAHPDANGFFLAPKDFGTSAYVNRQIALMRAGHWPKATVGDELKGLNWLLRRQKPGERPEDVCEVSFLDFAGEVYRAAFGVGHVGDSQGLSAQIGQLKSYVRDADDLIVLINLKDVIAHGLTDRRTEEAMWISNSILEYALNDKDGGKIPRASIVLSQADSYAEIISDCGGAVGTLSRFLPHVANDYSWLDIFAASAVDKTLLNGDGVQVPSPDFSTCGLSPVMTWILRGVAPGVIDQNPNLFAEAAAEVESEKKPTDPFEIPIAEIERELYSSGYREMTPQEEAFLREAATGDPAAAQKKMERAAVELFEKGEKYERRSRCRFFNRQKNHALAVECWMKSAELKCRAAQKRLGEFYSDYENEDHDYEEAHKWYLAAARQGEPEAQFEVGKKLSRYLLAPPTDESRLQAFKWFRLSAAQGHLGSLCQLGMYRENGYCGARVDVQEAYSYYQKAVDGGYKYGATYLIELHKKHEDYPIDYAQVAPLLKLATVNDIDSMILYGELLENGLGVQKDLRLALQYYQCAAGDNSDAEVAVARVQKKLQENA